MPSPGQQLQPNDPNGRWITNILRWIKDTERALRSVEYPLIKAIGLGLLIYHLVTSLVG